MGFFAFRYLAPLKRIGLSPRSRRKRSSRRPSACRELEMNRTAERTGILISSRCSNTRVQALADSGINARVESGTWDEVAGDRSGRNQGGRSLPGPL